MICPNERELLRYAVGAVPQGEPGVGEHIRECPDCASRLAELQGVWELMAEWQVRAPAGHLSGRILSAALAESRRAPVVWRMRVAASVLLAAGLGVAVGSVVPVAGAGGRASVTEDEVAEYLGLEEVGGVTGGVAANLEAEGPT